MAVHLFNNMFDRKINCILNVYETLKYMKMSAKPRFTQHHIIVRKQAIVRGFKNAIQ